MNHDMSGAARRHLDAAEKLANDGRRDVAGYLYSIAAECAIKAMVAGMLGRPAVPNERRKDPLYAHFPELRTMLRDQLQGRRDQPLQRIINDDRFFNNWEIQVRYAPSREIRDEWVTMWAEQARNVVNQMET